MFYYDAFSFYCDWKTSIIVFCFLPSTMFCLHGNKDLKYWRGIKIGGLQLLDHLNVRFSNLDILNYASEDFQKCTPNMLISVRYIGKWLGYELRIIYMKMRLMTLNTNSGTSRIEKLKSPCRDLSRTLKYWWHNFESLVTVLDTLP